MKLTLQHRLIKFLKKNPNRQLAKGDICRLAEDAMGVTGESVGRRLRILSEVSEWPHTLTDTPEHTKARELLGGAKVRRTLVDGHSHYTYEPPASKRVRRVRIEDGKAVEYWEDIEPPRVYRRVKHSKDEPYDKESTYPRLSGRTA